ncbi:hypothetical protein [uncultured Hoeflea sp.]|uniref:hypothetical protein n=1 Tax=uncultured Hoeflea sp. TaxID=538666 RepID=UPI0030DD8C95|tara:strand:- start:3219 stop:4574 length:1356 start_codon:yes stop_codon:yes gene_type:complete
MLRFLCFLFVLCPLAAKASPYETDISLCNESNETLYIAVRTEDGILTGGGYPTAGWTALGTRNLFKSCYDTRVSQGWTKHILVAVRRGNGFVPLKIDIQRGYKYGLRSEFCVSADLSDFSYRARQQNDRSCSAGYVLVPASVNIYGGYNTHFTMNLTGEIPKDALPLVGVQPTKEELAAQEAEIKRQNERRRREREKKRLDAEREQQERTAAALERQRLSSMNESDVFKEIRSELTSEQEQARQAFSKSLEWNVFGLCQPDSDVQNLVILFGSPDKSGHGAGIITVIDRKSWIPSSTEVRESIRNANPDGSNGINQLLDKLDHPIEEAKIRNSKFHRYLTKTMNYDFYDDKPYLLIKWSSEMVNQGFFAIKSQQLCINDYDSSAQTGTVCFAFNEINKGNKVVFPNVEVQFAQFNKAEKSGSFVPGMTLGKYENIFNCLLRSPDRNAAEGN